MRCWDTIENESTVGCTNLKDASNGRIHETGIHEIVEYINQQEESSGRMHKTVELIERKDASNLKIHQSVGCIKLLDASICRMH